MHKPNQLSVNHVYIINALIADRSKNEWLDETTYLQNEGMVELLILLGTEAAATAVLDGGDANNGFSCTASAASLAASSTSSIHFICMWPTAEPWTLP